MTYGRSVAARLPATACLVVLSSVAIAATAAGPQAAVVTTDSRGNPPGG